MTGHVHLVEVGPRDGLQNEPGVITAAQKISLITALRAAGLTEIEVGSFVSPKWVPQMADTAVVMAGLDLPAGVSAPVLVPNMRGWEAFAEARVVAPETFNTIAVFVSASEGFSRANINCSVAESLERLEPVVQAAEAAGVRVRGYLSCVFECPYDGAVAPAQAAEVVQQLLAMGSYEVSLGDTIGRGVPDQVNDLLEEVLRIAPPAKLAGHFHDTGGQAMENIMVALEHGLRVFDTSVGGLGGCPYAPGAAGNVATEAVAARLAAEGFETGVDAARLAEAVAMANALKTKGVGDGHIDA